MFGGYKGTLDKADKEVPGSHSYPGFRRGTYPSVGETPARKELPVRGHFRPRSPDFVHVFGRNRKNFGRMF